MPSSATDPAEAPSAGAGRRPKPGRRGFQWRKWNRILHRDLGYLCAGLTLVYAASGLAVNHFRDWNPNYDVRQETVTLEALPGGEPGSDAWARAVLPLVDVGAEYRGTFRPDPATVDVFVDGGTVSVELESRRATVETVRTRPLLRSANALHLNEPGGLWTWVADLYAAALVVLALTGLFVIKGRKGITGRGAWLTAVGVGVPLLLAMLVL